jgi:hypothetical protein
MALCRPRFFWGCFDADVVWRIAGKFVNLGNSGYSVWEIGQTPKPWLMAIILVSQLQTFHQKHTYKLSIQSSERKVDHLTSQQS